MLNLLTVLAATTFNPIFDSKFAPVIVHVANKYFNQPARLVFEMTNDPYSVFASEVVKDHNALLVIQKFPLPPLEELKNTMRGKCDIIILLGPSAHLPNKQEWQKLRWNPRGRVLLVTKANDVRALRIIKGIWAQTRTQNVVVAGINNDALEFYQWTPYRVGECSDVMTVDLIGKWQNGKFSENFSLGTNKALRSFNGCDLLFATTNTFPYVYNNLTDGIEMNLFNILAHYFNFTPRFVATPANEYWRARIYNGTHWNFSGPFKMLYEQTLDIVFSGLTAHIDRYEGSSPAISHMVENIVWAVPAPRVLPPIQNTFRGLSPESWFMIIISLGLGSIAVYITRDPKSLTYRTSFFYTLGTLLNGMPFFKSNNWYLRIITVGIIILAIHFFIAYQCSLIVLLTTPILEKPYTHLNQVMGDNLTCYTYTAGARLLNLDQSSYLPKNCKSYSDKNVTVINEIAYDRSAYLLLPERPLLNIIEYGFEDESGRQLVRRLKQPLLVLPISFYLAPGHPLALPIDEKILQMVECGIVDYWMQYSRRITLLTTIHHHQNGLKPLSMQHLTGAFHVFSISLAIALLFFIIEIITNRRSRKVQIFRRKRLQLQF